MSRPWRRVVPLLTLALLTACTSGPSESATPTLSPPTEAVAPPAAGATDTPAPTPVIPTEIPTIAPAPAADRAADPQRDRRRAMGDDL